jgi:HSP20 family protein
MALVQWGLEPRPARELTSLQSEVNRLFSSFFEPGSARPSPRSAGGWQPAMDVAERDDHYVLRADLPGVREEDISVELDGDVLTVSGRREAEHDEQREGYSRVERITGEFIRALTLPEGVDPERIEATYDRGVLEVRIPKPEQAQPRKVAIAVGARPADVEGSTS